MVPIQIKNLSKTFRGKKWRRVEALKGLSLDVSRGEVFGFLGPNGAGKSTTIKTLLGLIKPTDGQALLFGQPVDDSNARSKVGYLPENPALYDYLTAYEYLELVGCSYGMSAKAIAKESERVLALMSLTDSARRPIRGYSKGMVQRLGLAQAMLHDPDLYILDEPMSGLDPVGRALVKEIMLDLKKQGKTVFFSTHVIADVEAVCDRVGIIVAGQLEFVSGVDEVLRSGVEGYLLQISDCDPQLLARTEFVPLADGRFSVVVDKDQYQPFMKTIMDHGARVESIEPRRRNLEDLFLEIVNNRS